MRYREVRKHNAEIHIPQPMAKNAYELGKALGLLENEKFEEIFPEDTLKHLEKKASHDFDGWVFQMGQHAKANEKLRNFEKEVRFLKKDIWKITNLRQQVLAEPIVDIAIEKKIARRVGISPQIDAFRDALQEMMPSLKIKSIGQEYDENDQRTIHFLVNEHEVKMQANFDQAYLILEKVNECMKDPDKIFVEFQRHFSGWGSSYAVMLINKSTLHLEDNPFVPFYYKTNKWVIYQDPVTEEDKQMKRDLYQKGIDPDHFLQLMHENNKGVGTKADNF